MNADVGVNIYACAPCVLCVRIYACESGTVPCIRVYVCALSVRYVHIRTYAPNKLAKLRLIVGRTQQIARRVRCSLLHAHRMAAATER